VCTQCKKELSLDSFSKSKGSKDGLYPWCKECVKENNRIYRLEHKVEIQKYREKNKEKASKEHKIYYIEHKEEIAKYQKQWYIDNPDLVKKSNNHYNPEKYKLYTQKNKKKMANYQKKYRELNIDKLNEYHEDWRSKDGNKSRDKGYNKKWKNGITEEQKEYYKEYGRKYAREHPNKEYRNQWAKDNKDKINGATNRRRAKKRSLTSDFTPEQWEQVKLYFDNKCCYCGEELPLQQEHFVALSKGGGYTVSNMVCACGTCNLSKGDKNFEDWYPKFKHYNKDRETKILKYIENRSK